MRRTDKEIAADPAKLKSVVRLQALFRGRLARRRFRRMNKRTEIAREILSTERTYVSSLEVRRPIRSHLCCDYLVHFYAFP